MRIEFAHTHLHTTLYVFLICSTILMVNKDFHTLYSRLYIRALEMSYDNALYKSILHYITLHYIILPLKYGSGNTRP